MPAQYARESKGLGTPIRRRRLTLFLTLIVGILFFLFVPWELPSALESLRSNSMSRANVASLMKNKKVDEIYGLLHLVTGDHEQEHVLSNAVELNPTEAIELSFYAAGDAKLNWSKERDMIDKEYPLIVFSKTYCPYSKRAKALLEAYDLKPPPKIVEVDIRDDGNVIKHLLTRLTGHSTFPNIVVKGKSIEATTNARVEDYKWVALENRSPTTRFRDNLRDDMSYMTSWSNAGFTNQFMGYANMIYLATLTDRVPILAPFAPDHHINKEAGVVPFGDIFDLDTLRQNLRTPVLEWRDVKNLTFPAGGDPYSTSEVEPLGCWSTTPEVATEPIHAENVVRHLGVDASYTRVPEPVRYQPGNKFDEHVVLPRLAAVVYPRNPLIDTDQLKDMTVSPRGHHRRPDKHLTCLDSMYYSTSGSDMFEWRFSWSPVWRTIGRNLAFTPRMQHLGKQYLLNMFGDETRDDDIAPFIALHLRRGDFRNLCPKVDGEHVDCAPEPSTYRKYVEEMQKSLQDERNITAMRVVLMSDEQSPSFWTQVKEAGWFTVDHEKENTLAIHGEWYLPIIETAMLSYAVGFIGTHDSTFSLVAARRVEDWNNGIARITKWDEH
ncbi:hypothetical protein D9619_001468 [Psilocybe cf. subviscida]|uniref:Glutaredoxin domain-containing protein n=1 Tax=Psilocybe cf. subviscida TaxID=2480587 RepID=A0A8H5BG50_9AGAR|nr:hypothetical protein D9619_001468 [Psilocybe cf. subviscida]